MLIIEFDDDVFKATCAWPCYFLIYKMLKFMLYSCFIVKKVIVVWFFHAIEEVIDNGMVEYFLRDNRLIHLKILGKKLIFALIMFKRIVALNANKHHSIMLRLGLSPIIFVKISTLAKMSQHFRYAFMSHVCHANPKVMLTYLCFATSKITPYFYEICLRKKCYIMMCVNDTSHLNHLYLWISSWFRVSSLLSHVQISTFEFLSHKCHCIELIINFFYVVLCL